MATRITDKDLNILLDRINAAHGFEGKTDYDTNGAYGIDGAYGGVRLEQYLVGGGARTVSTGGYGTKRQLYAFMSGMLEVLNNNVKTH